jgi:hypothetical protein
VGLYSRHFVSIPESSAALSGAAEEVPHSSPAVATTPDHTEPQERTAQESKAGRLTNRKRISGGYVENDGSSSAESVVQITGTRTHGAAHRWLDAENGIGPIGLEGG